MPRPPKVKAQEIPVAPPVVPIPQAILPVQMAPAQIPGGPPVIDVAQFIRVRDSVSISPHICINSHGIASVDVLHHCF